MSRSRCKAQSKTIRDFRTILIDFVTEDFSSSKIRTDEVQALLVQILDLSRKKGRPTKETKEENYAA